MQMTTQKASLANTSEEPVSDEEQNDDEDDNNCSDLEVRRFQVEIMCIFLVLL